MGAPTSHFRNRMFRSGVQPKAGWCRDHTDGGLSGSQPSKGPLAVEIGVEIIVSDSSLTTGIVANENPGRWGGLTAGMRLRRDSHHQTRVIGTGTDVDVPQPQLGQLHRASSLDQ